MKKFLLTIGAMCAFGVVSMQGAQFDVSFTVSGNGYSSSSMTARTLSSIEFTASYSFSPNSACTEPFTIVRDGETVLSTLASEGKIVTEEDDWGDETTGIYFSSSPFNQAGTYTITAPEGFFRRSNGDTSNAKQVELKLTSPVPSSVTLVVDGTNVDMTLGSDDIFTAKGVAVTGAGSVRIQGTTYYGAPNGQPTAINIGEAAPIGYNGKNWSVPAGTYDVTVDWNINNPTVTFANAAPAVQTFTLGISVQGATPQNTANEFQRIDLPAQFKVYYLNNDNTEPITVAWGDDVIYSIDRTSSKLLAVDNDDDWDDDAYMINLGERVNRVGVYTITVPQGFFKSGSEVNAAVSKTLTITSPAPSILSLQGRSGSLDSDVDMTLEGSVFTASKVDVKDVANGYGEIRLMGNSWYGTCNNQGAEVSSGVAAPVGYQGGYWKVPAATYNVKVDWTDGNPNITFTKDTTVDVSTIIDEESAPVFFNLQSVRVINPLKGQILIEVRNGKASKIVY